MKWYTITEYVDIETGEALTTEQYTQKYYTVHKIKKITFNDKKTIGYIRYTHECRKKPEQHRFIF